MTKDLKNTTVSKDYLDNIFECMIDTLIVVSPGGTILRTNAAAGRLLGYQENELVGQPLEMLLDEKLPFGESGTDDKFLEKFTGSSEKTYMAKDGRKIPVMFSASVMRSDSGAIQGIVCAASDISERKRTEEELAQKRQELENKNKAIEENRNKLQGALAEISTLIESVIQTKDHNIRFSNPNIKKCYEIKNCKKEDCPCYGKEAVRCWQIAGTFCGGKVQGVFAQKFKNCSKCEVYKEATADPIYQIREHFNNMMNILKTKNKELEEAYEELQATTVKLSQSNTELGQFAYIASHDLQEPLRKVTAFGDRLKDKYAEALGEQGKDYLERMQNAAGRMQTLINDLLTYSRVTTKAQPFTSTDLSTIAKEVLSDLEIRIEQVKGRVEVGDLPVIDADPLQMRQLLQNLIGNALKFNKKDEAPVVKVHGMFTNCSGSAGNDHYQLTIEDNGIGFDEQYSERIFGVFQRLHGRSEYEGSGIGLSVCKKIVERHGGNITAKSAPGQGAKFIITLPVKQSIEVNA